MANYTIRSTRSVGVYNRAVEGGPNGKLHEARLCAIVDDPQRQPGSLKVGPCTISSVSRLPRTRLQLCARLVALDPHEWLSLTQAFYGPYFLVAYNEAEGYALVSGGQPSIPTTNGLCATGSGVNNAGGSL